MIPQKIAFWTQELRILKRPFQVEFGDLSTGELNWKPNSEKWSVGQIIEHIILINQSYFPILDQLQQGDLKLPLTARLPFVNKAFGRMILHSVSPENRKKSKTLGIWKPSRSQIDPGVLDRFRQTQDELIFRISNSANLLERESIIHSPVNKLITYPLSTAWDILVAHEKRHLIQAREVFWLQENTRQNAKKKPHPSGDVATGFTHFD